MKVIKTPLPGVVIIEPDVHGDARGFFLESFQAKRYLEAGLTQAFVQDNHSRSGKGVLRGMHCQPTSGQGKLVRVTRGQVFDVAVDIRRGSPTFGQWFGTYLDDEHHHQFYVPPGFAHGFCVLSDVADFQYKCTNYYYPQDEIGLLWNDPDVGIQWPVEAPVLSARDQAFPRLKDLPEDRLPRFADYPNP